MKVQTEIKRIARRFWRSERGTQFVELAIVLPVMVVLFAGVAEFGRFFYTYTTLAKATRAGARYISNQPYDCTLSSPSPDRCSETKNLVVYGKTNAVTTGRNQDSPILSGLDTSNVEITTPDGKVCDTQPNTVKIRIINYNYQPIFLKAVWGSTSTTIPASPSTTMRYLLDCS